MTLAWPRPPKPLVSNAIRQSARGKLCSLRWHGCDGGGETTVLAHIRRGSRAGVASKPGDHWAVYACASCHDALDGRRGEPVPDGEVLRALHETQAVLFSEGLLTAPSRKDAR